MESMNQLPAERFGEPDPTISNFKQLDRRVVRLWQLSHLISFAFLLVALLIGVFVAAIEDAEFGLWAAVSWFVILVLLVWLSIWRPPRLYRSWGYRIDEKVLETRSGLIIRVLRLLPLSRLQHVDLHRGPLERWFGLASLVLHTAGTHEATITIPGLDADEAVRLRNHLAEVGGDDAV